MGRESAQSLRGRGSHAQMRIQPEMERNSASGQTISAPELLDLTGISRSRRASKTGNLVVVGGRLVRLPELVDLKGEAAAVSDRKAPGDNAVLKRVQVHFLRDHVDDVAGIGE